MTIFDAVLLGVLQALGEFLPISSSAHLALLPYFRGMEYQGLAFDVMLHAATLLAVLLYFAKDWFVLIKDGLTHPTTPEGRKLWYLAAATVPAAVAGYFLNDLAENTFRNPLMIAVCLMVFACLLGWADKKGRKNPDTPITFKVLMIIGCAQPLALMPGCPAYRAAALPLRRRFCWGYPAVQARGCPFCYPRPLSVGLHSWNCATWPQQILICRFCGALSARFWGPYSLLAG